MKNQSIILYLLVLLVTVTFSAIGWLYQYQSSMYTNLSFYGAFLVTIILLFILFALQRKHFKSEISKITGKINRDWLQGLFSHFPMGILILDSTSNVLYVNQQACKIFKMEFEKIVTSQTLETLVSKAAYRFFMGPLPKEVVLLFGVMSFYRVVKIK